MPNNTRVVCRLLADLVSHVPSTHLLANALNTLRIATKRRGYWKEVFAWTKPIFVIRNVCSVGHRHEPVRCVGGKNT